VVVSFYFNNYITLSLTHEGGNKIEKTKEIEKPLPQDKSQGADDNEWD